MMYKNEGHTLMTIKRVAS